MTEEEEERSLIPTACQPASPDSTTTTLSRKLPLFEPDERPSNKQQVAGATVFLQFSKCEVVGLKALRTVEYVLMFKQNLLCDKLIAQSSHVLFPLVPKFL